MPSHSKAQHRFFEMIAHDPKAAKRVGVPQSVGKEFVSADKGKKFNQGGEMKSKPDLKKLFKGKESVSEELKEAKAIKSGKISPMQYAKGEESEKKMKCGGTTKMKCGGSTKKFASGGLTSGRGDGIASKGKTKCKYV